MFVPEHSSNDYLCSPKFMVDHDDHFGNKCSSPVTKNIVSVARVLAYGVIIVH